MASLMGGGLAFTPVEEADVVAKIGNRTGGEDTAARVLVPLTRLAFGVLRPTAGLLLRGI